MKKEAFVMTVNKNRDSVINEVGRVVIDNKAFGDMVDSFNILAALGDKFRCRFRQSCELLALFGGFGDVEVEVYMRQLGNE
eukprot:15102398-Ditylum_brightwellii.AAC.1